MSFMILNITVSLNINLLENREYLMYVSESEIKKIDQDFDNFFAVGRIKKGEITKMTQQFWDYVKITMKKDTKKSEELKIITEDIYLDLDEVHSFYENVRII